MFFFDPRSPQKNSDRSNFRETGFVYSSRGILWKEEHGGRSQKQVYHVFMLKKQRVNGKWVWTSVKASLFPTCDLLKQCHYWGPSVQTWESLGDISDHKQK